MVKHIIYGTFALLFLSSVAMPQADTKSVSPQPAKADSHTVNCRTMEVFVAKWKGASVVIFHQSDKDNGPKLAELLQKYTGQEVEFDTADGKRHRATVERI